MNDTCANCGYWKGLHHWKTMQCPAGGEAPVGVKQEWLQTVFCPDTSELEDEIAELKKQVALLQTLLA